MENFNENIIYLKEENYFEDSNVNQLEEVNIGEKLYDKNDENLKNGDYEHTEVKQEIIIGIESGYKGYKIKEEHVDEDIDIKKECNFNYVAIKEEEFNFMECDVERTSIEDVLDENNLSSFKSENISTNQLKFSDGTTPTNSHTVKSFKCIESGHSATLKSSTKDIKIDHLNVKRYQNSDPDYKASKEAQGGPSEKLYKCSYCDHSASRKFDLQRHFKIHTFLYPFKCDYCDYRASKKSSLQTHIRIHTGEKPFKCNFCDHAASDSSALRLHLRIHTGEKPYKCDFCDYAAKQMAHLRDHNRIHTNENPFKCSVCDFCTAVKSSLQRHLKTHTMEKNFKCNICDFATSRKSALQDHIRIHTGEKPFKCDFCDYSSARRKSLLKHIKTHTEEKTFKCAECDFSTSKKYHFTIHLRIHTDGKSFKCDYCDFNSSRKANLKRHIKIHKTE